MPGKSNLGIALFGKARRNVLALLFGHPERAFYLSEIVKLAHTGVSQIQLELKRLTAVGLLIREKRANQVYFRANPAAPIFEELKNIATKTFGVADVVREAITPLAKQIQLAFIYGSIARQDETARSDVDLLVIGDVSFSSLVARLADSEKIILRDVSPTVYSASEFTEKIREGHHFVSAILERPKLFLIGNEEMLDEFVSGKPEKP